MPGFGGFTLRSLRGAFTNVDKNGARELAWKRTALIAAGTGAVASAPSIIPNVVGAGREAFGVGSDMLGLAGEIVGKVDVKKAWEKISNNPLFDNPIGKFLAFLFAGTNPKMFAVMVGALGFASSGEDPANAPQAAAPSLLVSATPVEWPKGTPPSALRYNAANPNAIPAPP